MRSALAALLIVAPSLAAAEPRVLFTRGNQLYVVPAAGGAETRLAEGVDYIYDAVLTPDGQGLVIEAGYEENGLYLHPIAPAAKAKAPPRAFDHGNAPRFSPDGKLMAYGCYTPGEQQARDHYFSPGALCVAAADGSGRRELPLVSPTGGVVVEGWTADGKSVIYSQGGGDGKKPFFAVPVAGGAARQLISLTFSIAFPGTVSPDHTRYVWSTGKQIQIVPLDGSAPLGFGPAKQRGAWCVWSPDSTRLACSVELDGPRHDELYVYTADGKGGAVVDSAKEIKSLVWSADGTQLAYRRDSELAVAPARGGKVVPLTTGARRPTPLVWLQ